MLDNVLEQVPLILLYFLPGFTFMYILGYYRNILAEMKDTAFIYVSLVISFFITTSVKTLCPVLDDYLILSFVSTLVAVIISILLVYRMNRDTKLDSMIVKLVGHSGKNAIGFVADFRSGSFARITLLDQVNGESVTIIGKIHSYDSAKEPKFITLSDYEPISKANLPEEKSMSYKGYDFLTDKEFDFIVVPISSVLFIEIVNARINRNA